MNRMDDNGASISETQRMGHGHSPVPKVRASYPLDCLPHRDGFSLLELLIYMAVLSIVLAVIATIFVTIESGNARNQVQSEVDSNLRFAIQEIENDLRTATAVSTPTALGTSQSVLYIANASGTVLYCVASSTLWRATTVTPGVITWRTTTALPTSITQHSAAAYNGYLYVTGGAVTSTVFYSQPNANGSIGNWSTTRALPSTLGYASAAAYGGFLYVAGGNITSTVFYAPINSTGSIGNWSTTTALPTVLYQHSAVAYNGYVYTTGGRDNSGVGTSSVFYAQINSNGSISSWSSTTALPLGISLHSAVAYNGYVYTTGGRNSSSIAIPSVFYAPINATGSLGNWTSTTALPSALFIQQAMINNGYIYTTGGYNSSGAATSTVFYAQTTCNGSAITDSTVLVNNAAFTLVGNTNSVTGHTTESVKSDIVISYNGTSPDEQFTEEKVTTTALLNH